MYKDEKQKNMNCYEKKIITKENQEMNILINIENHKLVINCYYLNNYIKKTFINYFSFDDLKKISRYYTIFDNVEDILNEIIHNKSQKEIYIEGNEENSDQIKLVIPITIEKYPNISFELEQKEKSLEEDLLEKTLIVKHYLNELIIDNFNSKILIGKEQEKHNIKSWISINKKLRAELLYSFYDIHYKRNENNKKIYDNNINFEEKVRNFHIACDNKEKILIICKSKNEIFGGYTPLSFSSKDKYEYGHDEESFLFSLNNFKKYSRNYTKGNESIICHKDYGPCFHNDLNFKKKTINIVEFQRTQYNTSDNWVDKNNCFLSYDGILLDSLEIFQIIEEENNLQNNVNDIIDNDEISNDNKESDFIINTDKNMIEEKNISKQLKGKNKNEKNKKGLLEKEKKKYEENSKQNILDIRNSNDNSNFSLWDTYPKNNKTQENKTFRNKFDNYSTEPNKDSLNNNIDNTEEKEESSDD